MARISHRNSFKASGLNYYECVKATSIWFNDIAVEITELAADSQDEN
jgi:hypothetical protein